MTVTIENTYTGNGSTTDYSFTFPYLDTTDIKASLATVNTTAYSLLNATTVRFNSAPGNGVAIRIYRDTAYTNPKATFYPGSAIRAGDLNDNTLQNLYVTQESNDKVDQAWLKGDPTVISTETWHTSDDTKVASTKAIENRIAAQIDTAIEGDVLAGTDLTKTQTGGQVTINHSVTGAASVNNSNGSVIQDLTINGRGHITGTGSVNLDDRYYTETELNAGQLDNRYFTETELTGGALDGRYFTETEADARYYRLGSVEEIQSGETWAAADNKVATTAAIDARITDLVDDVGGFVPIANETSFPNANPDVNNGAGTLISIKALSGNLTSNGSGIATISNGNVANNATVTINGLENSTTYAATLGMIVETTSTLHTYTFHRITPKATEVTTVATNITNVNNVGGNISNVNTVAGNSTNINTVAGANSNITSVAGSISNVNTVASNITNVNSFAEKYRIASSQPTSSLDVGDLYFDTTNDELRVYNGSSWQGGVTATGNLVTKADIGAASGVPGTGSSGQYLQTNGSGTLSWQSIATVVSETDRIIASNYTLTTGKNAMSVGDVTIANGATLTIPANAFYKVI